MKPSRNILVVEVQHDSLYDESGVVCYEYGNMGEVTRETRIYALPFLTNALALSTQFEYDSWGRIQNITYPDNETVKYRYDCGGQLHKMFNGQGLMNNGYSYLDSVKYDRFGAKTSQKYGNGLKTNYTYDSYTRRLTGITTMNGANTVSSFSYTYDPVGNVTQVTSTNPWLPSLSFSETFTYDASDQLTSATESQSQSYSLSVTYGDWGKVNTYDLTQTDLLQNTTNSPAMYIHADYNGMAQFVNNAFWGENVLDGTTVSALNELDGNSNNIAEQASFLSETDLHLMEAGNLNMGLPVDFITTDADDNVRDAQTPTVGAYEYAEVVEEKPELEDLLCDADLKQGIPIGYELYSGKPFYIPVRGIRCVLIAGKQYCGRHTLLFNISITAARLGFDCFEADTFEQLRSIPSGCGRRKIITSPCIPFRA